MVGCCFPERILRHYRTMEEGGTLRNIVDIVVEVNKDNAGVLRDCFHADVAGETDTEIAEAFRAFDKDDDGYLGPADLRSLLVTLGLSLNEDQFRDFVKVADVNKDGTIDYNEFYRMMRGDSLPGTRQPSHHVIPRSNTRMDTDLSQHSTHSVDGAT